MKEREFWRDRQDGRVYAVELVDGVVAGACGPLDSSEIEQSFLPTFEYTPDRAAWVESHRADYEVQETLPGVAVIDAPRPRVPLESRLVSDVMHPGVMTCHSGSSIHDVARAMASHGVHCVAIWGDEGQDSIGLEGMISALDLLSTVMHGEPLSSPALTAARQDVHTVRASMPLDEAARQMANERASHVVVLADDRDRIVGVLSALDAVRALAHA